MQRESASEGEWQRDSKIEFAVIHPLRASIVLCSTIVVTVTYLRRCRTGEIEVPRSVDVEKLGEEVPSCLHTREFSNGAVCEVCSWTEELLQELEEWRPEDVQEEQLSSSREFVRFCSAQVASL